MHEHTETSADDFLGLGKDLATAFRDRPLTAREVIQWLSNILEQTNDLQQLQLVADHATGATRALYLCWLVSASEIEDMIAQLNTVYAIRQRELSGAITH